MSATRRRCATRSRSPNCARAIDEWQRSSSVAEEQQLFERLPLLPRAVQRAAGAAGAKVARIALVTVTNPPVNALNERALDELNIVVDHLARRDDVKAVVFTGQGTPSFVAGADIRQLLEDMHTLEQARRCRTMRIWRSARSSAMGKPCIAAIQGVALGGGMEFALACHYRIAEPLRARSGNRKSV